MAMAAEPPAGEPPARLTEEQVDVLAALFHTPELARQVLERAGLARARQPVWTTLTAEQYWREVNGHLAAGALVRGTASVLAAARHFFPENPVLRASAPCLAAGDAPDLAASAPPACDPNGPRPTGAVSNDFRGSNGIVVGDNTTVTMNFYGPP